MRCRLTLLLPWLLGSLAACVRDGEPAAPRDAGRALDAAGARSLGYPFEGELELEDDAVAAIEDPTLLEFAASPCRAPILARVRHAFDGDTVAVAGVSETLREHVRLIGIDTPEIQHEGQPEECFAVEALKFTRALEGQLVWLTFDTQCRDPFDRLLAYVHVGAGPQDVWERQLLRRGLADVLIVNPNRAFEQTLRDDEEVARRAAVGLWSACP